MEKTLTEIVKELQSDTKDGAKKLVVLPQNADGDAVASAVGLALVFPNVTIGRFENVSRIGKRILGGLGIEVIIEPDLDEFDTLVIVDASAPSQMGPYIKSSFESGRSDKKWIVIDHHLRTGLWDVGPQDGEVHSSDANMQVNMQVYFYSDDTKSSCAELVYQIVKCAGFDCDKRSAMALLTGIVTDTGRFRHGSSESLRTFVEIMTEGGVELDEVLSLMESDDIDISQKIAHLKGAQRLKYEKIGKLLIATSRLSAFEASTCKMLLFLGADIAFVGAQRENTIRISARAKSGCIKAGLHLGQILNTVGKETNCDGGGHAGAAGLNGVGDVEALLNICVDVTRQDLLKLKNG